MFVTELGMVTLVKWSQYLKALFAMFVTELPIVTEVSFLHLEKALSAMFVTELGMVTDVKSQELKAHFPMLVTELPIVTEFKPEQYSFVAYIDNQIVTTNKVEKSYSLCLEGAKVHGFNVFNAALTQNVMFRLHLRQKAYNMKHAACKNIANSMIL